MSEDTEPEHDFREQEGEFGDMEEVSEESEINKPSIREHSIQTRSHKDEPLPLLTVEGGKFKIHEEAFELMKSIPAPFGVIAVAGMYRTGKSYLLNRVLLNRKGGFGVGPTIQPCTKGLWIWGRPL